MCCLYELYVHLSRFNQDHATASLIWNYKTREELREALENEMRAFTIDRVSVWVLVYINVLVVAV